MTNLKITTDKIATLEKALKSADTATKKKLFKDKIAKLKEALKTGNTEISAKELADSLLKSRKKFIEMASKDFDAVVKRLSEKPEYAFLKGYTRSKIIDDIKRKAKPVGWRFKGKNNYKIPTKEQVTKGRKNKTVYYENRPERSDVSQIRQLKHGGEVDIMLTDDDLGYYSILHKGEFIEKDFQSKKEAENWAKENNYTYAKGGEINVGDIGFTQKDLDNGKTYSFESSNYNMELKMSNLGRKSYFIMFNGEGHDYYTYASFIKKVKYFIEKYNMKQGFEQYAKGGNTTNKPVMNGIVSLDEEYDEDSDTYIEPLIIFGYDQHWKDWKPTKIELQKTRQLLNEDLAILKKLGIKYTQDLSESSYVPTIKIEVLNGKPATIDNLKELVVITEDDIFNFKKGGSTYAKGGEIENLTDREIKALKGMGYSDVEIKKADYRAGISPQKPSSFINTYAKGGKTLGGDVKPHYNATAYEHRHNLTYGDSKRFATEKEAIEWGMKQFKSEDVGVVDIDRVRPKSDNPNDVMIDTVFRINETYPLGERVVMKPYSSGGEIHNNSSISSSILSSEGTVNLYFGGEREGQVRDVDSAFDAERLAKKEGAEHYEFVPSSNNSQSMAKGGMVEHGLKIGDMVISKGINTIVVENSATTSSSKKYVVNLQNGTREDYDLYESQYIPFDKGGSLEEESPIIRYYFEDDGYEYNKGGEVDVDDIDIPVHYTMFEEEMYEYGKGGIISVGDNVTVKSTGQTMEVSNISKNTSGQVEFTGSKGTFLIGGLKKN